MSFEARNGDVPELDLGNIFTDKDTGEAVGDMAIEKAVHVAKKSASLGGEVLVTFATIGACAVINLGMKAESLVTPKLISAAKNATLYGELAVALAVHGGLDLRDAVQDYTKKKV